MHLQCIYACVHILCTMLYSQGGCISAYEVELVTSSGNELSYTVERKSCAPFYVFNISLSSEYYIATITSLTNGESGHSRAVLVRGSKHKHVSNKIS